MQSQPTLTLSIVVVNWNGRAYLLQCLRSVFGMLHGLEMEVFVVDNGSQDGSVAAVRETFPKVSLIENDRNLGFAKANNQALEQARGRYLLLLNPDTVLKEGAIERLIEFMDGHGKVALVGPQLLHPDGSRQNSIANFPSLATELLNKPFLRFLFPGRFPGKEQRYSEPIEVESVIGACMLVRWEAANQVGLLDDDYFLFFEETDWCYRMRKAGWKVCHHPLSEIYHMQGQSAKIEKGKARVEYYRSRYHFFRKNRGKVQWFLLLVGVVTRLLVEWLFAGVVCLVTLFRIEKWRQKWSVFSYLIDWHVRGCPEDMGLREKTRKA